MSDAVGRLAGTAAATAGHVWRRQSGRVRRAGKEVLSWGINPGRPIRAASQLPSAAAQLVKQLPTQSGETGSPLWRQRSRHRRFELIRVPLDEVKAAGKALGGTVNDVFVTGAALGAIRYHERRNAPLEALNITFVVSTRGAADGDDAAGNAFSPTPIEIPAGPMAIEDRFTAVHDRILAKRRDATGGGILGAVAGLANLLPTSLVTGVARAQTAKIDFATSNVRASPLPVYTAGAKLLWTGTLGPVAGTAFNITTLSYAGSLDIGITIDPAAVEDPGDLRDCLESGYAELLAAGGQTIDG